MGGERQREGKEGMKQGQRLRNWDKSLPRDRKELSGLLLALESSERGGLGEGGALSSLCAAEHV